MSNTIIVSIVLIVVALFYKYILAYALSVFIRLAVWTYYIRIVRKRRNRTRKDTHQSSSHHASSNSELWRVSPNFINMVLETGRFLSVKSSFSYGRAFAENGDGRLGEVEHGVSSTVGNRNNKKAHCCVTQVKLEQFKISSIDVVPLAVSPSVLSSTRKALLELAFTNIRFKVHVSFQILEDPNEPKTTSFLRLFNKTNKQECVRWSLAGEFKIGNLRIFLFHPYMLSGMIRRMTDFLMGTSVHGRQADGVLSKNPVTILSNILPAVDVYDVMVKLQSDMEYPSKYTDAEGAFVEATLRLRQFALRMPDPTMDGPDPRISLGLPHQLAADDKIKPSNVILRMERLLLSMHIKLKKEHGDKHFEPSYYQADEHKRVSTVSIPSALFDVHLQPKRNLTSYLASVQVFSGDKLQNDCTGSWIVRKEDVTFVKTWTGDRQIMDCLVFLRRTLKPVLMHFDLMQYERVSRNSNSVLPYDKNLALQDAKIEVVLFSLSTGVKIGLDDNRISPLRLTAASILSWTIRRKETGVLINGWNDMVEESNFVITDLCLRHQRYEEEIFDVLNFDELTVKAIKRSTRKPVTSLDDGVIITSSCSGSINVNVRSMKFNVCDPGVIEDLFHLTASLQSTLAYSSSRLISVSWPPRKRKVKSKLTVERTTIILGSIDLYVSIACLSDGVSNSVAEKIVFVAQGKDAVISMMSSQANPSDNFSNKNSPPTNDISVNFSSFESSLEFTPHNSLPLFAELDQQGFSGKHSNLIQFDVCGSGLKVFITRPSTERIEESKSGSSLNVMINSLNVKERVTKNSGIAGTTVLKSNGLISFSMKNTEIIPNASFPRHCFDDVTCFERLDVFVDFYGSALHVTWSPVLQWLIFSAIVKIETTLNRYRMSSLNRNMSLRKKRKVTNITIRTNGAGVYARLVLCGGSIIDIATHGVVLKILRDDDATWEKPNLMVDAANTTVYVNEESCEILNSTSIHYSEIFRRATVEEISSFLREGAVRTFKDDIVTGIDGCPLMSIVRVRLGIYTKLGLSPNIHLGKVIDDLSTFPKIMDYALRASKLSKNALNKERKCQLMNILASFNFLDATFFENLNHPHNSNLFQGVPRLNLCSPPLIDRWRFHVNRLDCMIKRETPMYEIQRRLNDLDEDKSHCHRYGPVVQGGNFYLTVEKLVCFLHPLTVVTPLVCIDKFKVDGFLYLATLDPQSPQVRKGNEVMLPIICHHGKSVKTAIIQPSNCDCKCTSRIKSQSTGIPMKIYYDLNVASRATTASYGLECMIFAIPKLMDIIKRLIPCPCQPHYPPPKPTSALSWWDNLRYQFHGRIKFVMEQMSLFYLLDLEHFYDRSILLSASKVAIEHSCGLLSLACSTLHLSLPGRSYHIFKVSNDDTEINGKQWDDSTILDERHSLLLIHSLKLNSVFTWDVSNPELYSPYAHHNPYFNLPYAQDLFDNFEPFRSKGINVQLKIEIGADAQGSDCWLALRVDVLPWLAHKKKYAAKKEKSDDNMAKQFPEMRSLDLDVSACNIQVATWFDESVESFPDTSDVIHLAVPSLCVNLNNTGRKKIAFCDPIRAARLNVESELCGKVDARISVYENYYANLSVASIIDFDCDRSSTKHIESLKIIERLKLLVTGIKSLDYLFTIDQMDILNQSLDEMLHETQKLGENEIFDVSSPNTNPKEKAPWTVLVAGLKLLWTLDIRDSVMSVVRDLLFAINYVRVNSRGTAQFVGTSTEKKMEKFESLSSNSNIGFLQEEAKLRLASGSTVSRGRSPSIDERSLRPRSYLDYLLNAPTGDSEIEVSLKNTKSRQHDSCTRMAKSGWSSPYFKRKELTNESAGGDETVPRFDIHLANPQIQLHSKSTGGGVILAMRGAFVESRRFVHLFSKEAIPDIGKPSVDTLLCRTDFRYTLENMEVYSTMSPSSDLYSTMSPSSDLEWLKLSTTAKLSKFPKDLSLHEPREYDVSDLALIMERCTFKTRQECHNPPIEFTKEELDGMIQANLVKELICNDLNVSQDMGALECVDIAIDKLSFLLDTYQFSTTQDVVRNVLLEPPKVPRRRFYRSQAMRTEDLNRKSVSGSPLNNGNLMTELMDSLSKMKEALQKIRSVKSVKHLSKRDKDTVKSNAQALLEDLEEIQTKDSEPSLRRIRWSLSKVKWEMKNKSIEDRVIIDFTGLKGYHDFPSSGGINSQITLEDVYVSSELGPEANNFPIPSAIIKAELVGVEKSPCERCGKTFERSSNDSNACSFHPGIFAFSPKEDTHRWTCCKAVDPDPFASGCASRPHTGKERAVALRLDACPRVVEGLTIYRHAECNFFPGVPHILFLQFTKRLGNIFDAYFVKDDSSSTVASDGSEVSSGIGKAGKMNASKNGVPKKSDLSGGQQADNKKKGRKVDANMELYFIKYWRLGEVNLKVSLAGFNKYVNHTNVRVFMSSFQTAYKIGSKMYIINRLRAHLLLSLASSGIDFLRKKISGMREYLDEEDEIEEKRDHEALLLGSLKKHPHI